jgi:hypothetical protein
MWKISIATDAKRKTVISSLLRTGLGTWSESVDDRRLEKGKASNISVEDNPKFPRLPERIRKKLPLTTCISFRSDENQCFWA